jgi:uncharacterized protein YndB with AHSA1/START domain
MTEQNTTPKYELSLTRVIDAPRDKIFKAWTNPELVKQWFAPLPWTTPHVEMDVRAGGANLFVMSDPDGNQFPNRGVYLDVVENEKLVFTDAFTSAWVPSAKPFMVGTITLEDLDGGKTRYTATVLHWSEEDRQAHENMGFHQGWGQCTDQLAALVARI